MIILNWWNKIDKTYPKAIYWVAAGVWFIVGSLPLFGYSEPFKDIRNFIILALGVFLLILITCFLIYIFRENKNDIDATIKKAKKMLAENRNEDILILRKRENWSRSLWVEGKPYARLKLGRIAEIAAMNLESNKDLAEICIDDLGWTNASVERYETARKIITHGLEYAKKIEDNDEKYYWLAKAKRHLAGIEIENKEFNKADSLTDEAALFANKIIEQQRKNEMLAGIYYGQSIRFLKASSTDKSNIETSLKYAEDSEKLRKFGEKTRFVKIYSLKGNIYEAKDDKHNAEKQYRKGLEQSRDLGRTDEIIKNSLGLARVLDDEKEKKQHIKLANKLLDKTPVPYIIDEKEMRLIKL